MRRFAFFTLDPDELETPWFRLFVPVKPRISRKPSPLNDATVDVSGGMLVVHGATVLALAAKSKRWERIGLDVVELTRAEERSVAGERPGCGGSHGFWRSWCRAAVRVCQTFSSPC